MRLCGDVERWWFFSNKHSSIAYKIIRSAPTAFEQRLILLPDFRLCLSHRLAPHRSDSACRVYFNPRHGLFRRRHLESIAEPGFGADKLRLTWIGLKFPTQLSNEDSKILRLSAVTRSPNRSKHHLMPDRLSLIRNK